MASSNSNSDNDYRQDSDNEQTSDNEWSDGNEDISGMVEISKADLQLLLRIINRAGRDCSFCRRTFWQEETMAKVLTTLRNPPPVRPLVTVYRQIGGVCPSRWEGELDNDQKFYIRYRHGYLSVEIDDTLIWSSACHEFDPAPQTGEMRSLTGHILNWSNAFDQTHQ